MMLSHPDEWFDPEKELPKRAGYSTSEVVLTFCPKMRNYCPFIVGRLIARYAGDGSIKLIEKWESCETGEEIYPSLWQPIGAPDA